MVKIEAPSLEDAYKEASLKFRCSVTALDIEIIQQPSKGVFGFGKKSAIIIAAKKHSKVQKEVQEEEEFEDEDDEFEEQKPKPKLKIKPKAKKQESNQKTSRFKSQKVVEEEVKKEFKPKKVIKSKKFEEPKSKKENVRKVEKKVRYKESKDTEKHRSFVTQNEEYVAYDEDRVPTSIDEIAQDIEEKINDLFDLSCFEIDKIEVTPYDENSVLVKFDGEDSALLIGKEGYRYKALSYMIFNWINSEYNVQLILEISEFLKNQEEAVDAYLVGVFETIENEGRAQTKILDGVLIQIALKKLRNEYPDKYIVVRSNRDGLKYIIINDYHVH
jgi:spoIIIJ-associated protein